MDDATLVDKKMPKSWTCPRCKKRNYTGKYADDILNEHFKYIEQCTKCGALHLWILPIPDNYERQEILLEKKRIPFDQY